MSDGKPFHEWTAGELLAGYARGTVSPVEATKACLARINAWEPQLNALYTRDGDHALRQAEESARRWAAGSPLGPLDGVPLTVKENIASKGVPAPIGTAASNLSPAEEDAPPVSRIREAGGIIIAKTTMPDYGMLSSGVSSLHGVTRNPWDLAKNPGGSSAGAGAACAAGYAPLHLGTDIGGSVRLPATWCGIFALKPSLGRVPIDPPYVGRVAGPMTRTVEDAALFMSVLSKPDFRDPMSLPPADIAWMDLERPLRGVRFGLMSDAGAGDAVDEDVRAVTVAAAQAFQAQGATVEEAHPIMTEALLTGLDAFWRARAWADISLLAPGKRDAILPFIRIWAEKAASLNAMDAVRGFNATMSIRAAAARLFQRFDFILSPVAPVVSFPAEYASPSNDPDRPYGHIVFTVPWNMSEQPAASINSGYSASGFPIGVQIVGRRFDDLGVLQMAKAFEAIRLPQRPWPEPA